LSYSPYYYSSYISSFYSSYTAPPTPYTAPSAPTPLLKLFYIQLHLPSTAPAPKTSKPRARNIGMAGRRYKAFRTTPFKMLYDLRKDKNIDKSIHIICFHNIV
jgi:hypothetical protein